MEGPLICAICVVFGDGHVWIKTSTYPVMVNRYVQKDKRIIIVRTWNKK